MKKLLALLLVVLSVHYIYATTQETSGINYDQSYWNQYARRHAYSIRKEKNGDTMTFNQGNKVEKVVVKFFEKNGTAKKIREVEVYQDFLSTEVLTCDEVEDLILQIKNPLDETIKRLESELKELKSKTEVDSILNITDDTIFDQIKNVKEEDVPLRSKDFYNLVKTISDLRELLDNTTISSITESLKKAESLIDKVNSYKGISTQGLTDVQQEVIYRLVDDYNSAIIGIYGNNEDY